MFSQKAVKFNVNVGVCEHFVTPNKFYKNLLELRINTFAYRKDYTLIQNFFSHFLEFFGSCLSFGNLLFDSRIHWPKLCMQVRNFHPLES